MVENLQIYDMVWGLTHLNRFTGKADRQVNVAAHSLHCLLIASIWKPDNKELQLYALTHDLPEAYYGDFPGFLKNELGADFTATLARIDDLVFGQLGLSKDVRLALEPDLKRIDNNALALEAAVAFDKFESYHWPKTDIYSATDIIDELITEDDVHLYNSYNFALENLGESNEVLANLLHSHRSYSHPRRHVVR